MTFSRLRRRLAFCSAAVVLAGTPGARADEAPIITGKTVTSDLATGESVLTGDARIVHGDTILTADEIRYNTTTGEAVATGHFNLTTGKRRLVADRGTYNLATGHIHVVNLRLGQFPVYLSGETVNGTLDELVFTNATVFFRENAGYTPSLHARHLTYARGRIVRADGLSLGLLGGHFLPIPHFEQALDTPFVSYVSASAGYRGNLGAFGLAGLHLPVAPGLKLGADGGFYTSRGLMLGPSGRYHDASGDSSIDGWFKSGYIYDYGSRGHDILGRTIPHGRSYFEWEHRQNVGEHFTLNGQFNYWSDSEILRDFANRTFRNIQQPDSFLEAAYTGENYVLSAFARFHPNQYHRVQERLPEVRFDQLPTALPLGLTERFFASAAELQADAFGPTPDLRTNRLDAYYGLARTLALTPWLALTPVAGGRVTHYTDARNGRSTYTRTLGEAGFDAHLLASGTFDYKNPLWDIDGLRHLVQPTLSYRYAPEAAAGRAYIPPIDTRVFSTYLQPLSIADSRNIDDLTALNTLRVSLNNTLQTRDPKYGSRDLATLNFAADYRFDHATAPQALSDLYTEFALQPAPWLRWEVFHRFDPHHSRQQELNTGLTLADQEWWSARLATHYLRGNYEEYYLEYRQRLDEVWDVAGQWRYDARNRRFDEQSYGLWQRIGQTWAVKYEVSWFSGPRRESSFALNLEVELLKF
ncbi:MAG TPA: LPS assembly protein LptD [Lacunisphaera sp.]|jgi:LPS-assembly protein|nr:LPS assembly protein LptD [Lacunisphaera sp.]